MLSWALAFFVITVITAVFGFTGVACTPGATVRYANIPPAGWVCPEGWTCAARLPLPAPSDFVCPQGWNCSPAMAQAALDCGASEIAKILFVVFSVLFLISLLAGLLQRP